jgi:peroxiredoxin
MALATGQPAPDFTLLDTNKTKITLSDYRGKNVLLLFFPLAFTSVCTRELCGIRDSISGYSNEHAEVFGISVDSLFSLGKFKELEGFNFPLLSDFNKKVSTQYDCIYEHWYNDMDGVSKRSAYIIDKEGIIKYAEVLENAGEEPDYAAINQVLDGLK